MKKIIIFLMIFNFSMVSAQYNPSAPWMKELNVKRKSSGITRPAKFQEIVDAFNEYWKDKDHTRKGSGYKPFMRWQNFWKHRLNPDGTLLSSGQLMKAVKEKQVLKKNSANQSNWSSLGPTDFINRTSNDANIGRLNTIAVDPNNPNIYYAGAPAGGLWKSDNAGVTWIPLTDELPQIGVSAIVIDPLDSKTIYIGTGDDDRGDTNSLGILKSIDGGKTWNETGFSFFTSTGPDISELAIDRSNGANTIFVASGSGFYKSIDGGNTFTQTLNGRIRDIRLKPGDANVIYTISKDKFYKSIDNGDSFVQITNGLPTSSVRLVIDVTPAAPEYVYVLSAKVGNTLQGLYKSTNSGASFTRTKNNEDILETGQVFFCMGMAVSDTNPDEVYTGVLNIWKTTDGGDSFTRINRWFQRNATYTHADINFLRFFNGNLFCASDGGFFRSSDKGASFKDLTVGMDISQFYKIAVSEQNSQRIAGGTQDNGSFGMTTNGQWSNYGGGDGMDAAINPKNQNHYCGFMQNGKKLWISYDAGISLDKVVKGPEDSNGNWVTPLDFNSEGELYAGYGALYKLNGDQFIKISANFPSAIDELEIDPINPNNIYVSINRALYKSTNRGITFNKTQEFNFSISAIEVSNDDSDIVYITTDGSYGEVLKSTDGALNFTDITGNLPRVSKLDIAHQAKHVYSPIFIATDVGVYRMDESNSEWEVYDTNLPNTAITDLEINPLEGIITAGTYGRGIWQSSIEVQFPCVATIPNNIIISDVKTDSAMISWDTVSNTTYEIRYREEGKNWITLNNNASTSIVLNELIPSTSYQIQVRSMCPNGNVSSYTDSVDFITENIEVGYCNSSSNSSLYEYISMVNIEEINHLSINANDGYTDNTSISTELTTEQSYTIAITPTWSNNVYDEAYSVWIDYNQDGDFTDIGEQVFTQSPTQNSPVSGSFTIPSKAILGETIMRVSMKYNEIPLPCESFNYGEVEDYTVIIKEKILDTEAPSTPTGLVASTIEKTSLILSWDEATDNIGVTAYYVFQDNIKIATVTNTSIPVINLNENTDYAFKVIAIDLAGNSSRTSDELNIKTLASSCVSGVSSFPYTEGFENTFGDWIQATTDDLNWTLHRNKTTSSRTGPSSATQGTYYIYVEASGNNIGFPTKQAILTSPCFDLSNETQANFSFEYHMYGDSDMGSIALEASIDNGNTWTSIWDKTGNQGDVWQQANIDLSSYTGSGLQLRFNRTTGSSWQADIAIDAIKLSTGTINDACINIALGINFDNYPGDISWEIIDANNNVVAFGNDYESESWGSSIVEIKCLPPGTYRLVMSDSYGDGLCCNYGNGSYVLTVGDATLASGASFGTVETTTFTIGDPLRGAYFEYNQTTEAIKTSIYPNPLGKDRILNIESQKEQISYVIRDILGRVVKKGVVKTNRQIQLSSLEGGVYLLTLDVGKPWTKRFVIE